MSTAYRIAVLPGDGIGKEVMLEGVKVVTVAARTFGFQVALDEFEFASTDYYLRHGTMLGKVEGVAQDAVDARPRHDRLLHHELPVGALEHAAADTGVFTLGVLPDDDEVDVPGRVPGQRCRYPGQRTDRSQ